MEIDVWGVINPRLWERPKWQGTKPPGKNTAISPTSLSRSRLCVHSCSQVSEIWPPQSVRAHLHNDGRRFWNDDLLQADVLLNIYAKLNERPVQRRNICASKERERERERERKLRKDETHRVLVCSDKVTARTEKYRAQAAVENKT